MAAISPISTSVAGTSVNGAAANSGGDTIPNPRGNVFLHVRNGGGSSINVTLTAQTTTRPAEGQFPAMTLSNQVVAVPAGEAKLIGPIPSAFNDASGNVNVAYSSVTSVTVWSLQPPN